MNTCHIDGYLVKDPRRSIVGNKGNECVTFTIANRCGGKNNTAKFIPCSAWKSQADFIEKYFKKGDPILVHGRVDTYPLTDKKDRQLNGVTITIQSVEFPLTRKAKSDQINNNTDCNNANDNENDSEEDGAMIPF